MWTSYQMCTIANVAVKCLFSYSDVFWHCFTFPGIIWNATVVPCVGPFSVFSYGITEVRFGDSIGHTKYCTLKLLMTGALCHTILRKLTMLCQNLYLGDLKDNKGRSMGMGWRQTGVDGEGKNVPLSLLVHLTTFYLQLLFLSLNLYPLELQTIRFFKLVNHFVSRVLCCT